ncbi:uncharacterized protein HaLaN_30021, partial [Haematococcus lacustris]
MEAAPAPAWMQDEDLAPYLVVLDYFYTLDEYTSYNFISFGPAATASAAVTARARGIISAVAKAEAFTQSIWTLTRDDYADRTRQ